MNINILLIINLFSVLSSVCLASSVAFAWLKGVSRFEFGATVVDVGPCEGEPCREALGGLLGGGRTVRLEFALSRRRWLRSAEGEDQTRLTRGAEQATE